MFAGLRKISTFATANAEIAQLVEHNLAKVRVASSSLVFRSFLCFVKETERRCVKMHTFIILRTKPRLSQAGALLLPKDSVSLGIRISL